MPVDFIPARADLAQNPQIEAIIRAVRKKLEGQSGVIYYSWPNLKDYDDVMHRGDLTVITASGGLKLVVYTASGDGSLVKRKYDETSQLFALVESQLSKSSALRIKRQLKVKIEPILFAPNSPIVVGDEECTFLRNEGELIEILLAESSMKLNSEDIEEVRSILEGAKALSRPKPRTYSEDGSNDLAAAYAELEEVIANFDVKQRGVAMTSLTCPQRIRGLAGTGKTVILAMKAALTHANDPTARILVTYYTRSLKNTIERLISRFYRHFADGDPNWDFIHVRHGWGRSDLPGVYRDACTRSGVMPISFNEVKGEANPFGFVCGKLLEKGRIAEFYDLILIDEGQDFPDSFYQMCFFMAKGHRDSKRIIWAYDELQNVFDVKVRAPDALFGVDEDGEPRISLTRSLPEGAETNDHVLQKSYRNQREVLVLAHALGFGVYGHTVQMLENRSHWEDVGYDVLSGSFEVGSEVVVKRPRRNSPVQLRSPVDVPLMSASTFADMDEEVEACVSSIREFVARGLRSHDILVIALDDRNARGYLSRISKALARAGIQPNNLLGAGFDEPPFSIEDHVTLSSVYRAKGNEAAVVFVVGADGVTLQTRTGRNRVFTAFTRTKGWLRISGFSSVRFRRLLDEIKKTQEFSPEIRFTMPNMTELNTIQRDLEEKHVRLTEARTRFEKMKSELKLTEDDIQTLIEDGEF